MDPSISSSLEPYPGLRSFRKEESDIFFGRDDHIGEMIDKLSESHFLCITGSSGCGKSSLARTGLMNHLEAGFLAGRGSDWIFCDLHPGDHPIDNLFRGIADSIASEVYQEGGGTVAERAELIRSFLQNHVITQRRSSDLNAVLDLIAGIEDRPVMILVDQFEELFRFARLDSEAAVNLVEILLKTAVAMRNIYVVITIRTDELERCSRYPGLTRLINESQFLTPVLDRYQIQQAIEGPISLWNGQILPDLSTWLLNSLEDELDKLPLMQHALRILYAEKKSSEKRDDVAIGLADFIRVFGLPQDLDMNSAEGRLALRHTLSDRLTQRYNALPEALKLAAKRMFCALTAVDSLSRDIREPQRLANLANIIGVSEEDTRRIVRAFSSGDETYLRFDRNLAADSNIDVTHECILRLWRPLQTEWLVEEKRSGDNIQALARLARTWISVRKDRSPVADLFAGIAVKYVARDQYQAWFDRVRPSADWAGRYLGKIEWPAPSDASAARPAAETIFRSIQAFLVASRQQKWLLVVISILLVVATGVGISVVSYQFAKSKAREARRLDDQIIISGLRPEQTRVSQVETTLEAIEEGSLANFGAVWANLHYVHELYRFNANDEIHAADFAADGKSILAIDKQGILHQWAVSPMRKVLRELDFGLRDPDGKRAQGRSLIVSPLGDVAAVGFNQGSVVLLDMTATENRFKVLQIAGANPHGIDSVFKVVFSEDGQVLVTSSRAGNIVIWERPPSQPAQSDDSRPVDPLVWNGRNIDLRKVLPAANIWAVDIDKAKQMIAVGLNDGAVCLLRIDDPENPFCSYEGGSRSVKAVKFVPNKLSILSAGNNSKVTIWDFDPSARTLTPLSFALEHENTIWDIGLNHDGSLLATASFDGSIRVYQTGTWRLLNTVAADQVEANRRHRPGATIDSFFALRTVRFDSASSMLVTSSLDHTARVWTPLVDRAGVRELSYRLPPTEDRRFRSVYSVAVSPDGNDVAFTDQMAVYALSRGQLPEPLPLDTNGNANSATSPDGGRPKLKFSQVLMRTPNEILASHVDPRMTVWARPAGSAWKARTVELPGDPILAGRAAAVGASGALLGVEVRTGEAASILLCPIGGGEQWNCPSSQSTNVRMFPLKAKLTWRPTDQDCASVNSEVHVAISKSGRLLAASAGKCPIQVFDLQGRDEARSYGEHVGDVNTIEFSPDETALLASSQAGEVLIWELAGGSPRNISYHSSPFVTAARYSPSGEFVASSSNDNSVIVSYASSGQRLVTLPYRNSLFDIAIAKTSHGTLIATGSEAGDVNVGRFFEDSKSVSSYGKSVLRDFSP